MGIIEGTTDIKTAQAEYDFAVDGGAISTISLRGSGALGSVLPTGSVVTGGFLEINTLFTTGTAAVMSIDLEAAGDIVASTIVSGAPYSTTGRKSIIPAGTGATSVKTTVARQITVTIATGTVTAGKFRIVLFYK